MMKDNEFFHLGPQMYHIENQKSPQIWDNWLCEDDNSL